MIVVADTSVLLNLCRIGQVELLARLFGDVVIPTEVASEFENLSRRAARFEGLKLPNWIRQQSISAVPAHVRAAGLDAGETAAVVLALELHAEALLMDERRGHRAAVKLGLRTIGVLGILLQAKASAFVVELKPLLTSLEVDAQFWISPAVRERVLRLAGES